MKQRTHDMYRQIQRADCGVVQAEGAGVRIEIMIHARTLVELIHECSVALCEWQKQTTTRLILEKTGLSEAAARRAGLIA